MTVSDTISFKTGFETTVVRPEQVQSVPAKSVCTFCNSENPGQAFTCGTCLSTLTLSDLEMLLANSHADREVLRNAVARMEAEKAIQPLTESELTNLGIAYLNLRDFQTGYQHLFDASQLNPNNVVLASQVNALLIRLDEIKRQEEAHEAMPKEKKILVVDDSATVRKLIAGKLEKCGHQVFCAADGVEAIEQLDSIVPDLILLDITMPRMDGYQVCKTIRGNEATKDVPVVMISGKDGFFDKVRGRMAGTTGYITKPFGPETLMKAVETYLKGEVVE
jgi:twitching motility two-component system response regulator PilG